MSYAAFPVNDVLAACANYFDWRNEAIRNYRVPLIERTLRRHRSGVLGWFHRKMGHTIDLDWAVRYLRGGDLFSDYNIQDIRDWGRAGYIESLQSLAKVAADFGVTTIHVSSGDVDRLKDFWPRSTD